MSNEAQLRQPARFERSMYLAIAAGLGVAYLIAGIGLSHLGKPGLAAQATWFGFSQVRWVWIMVAVVAAVVVLWRASRSDAPRFRVPLESTLLRLGLAALATVVFFVLRSHFINPDGAALPFKFMRDVPWLGAHVTHDEMLELYVHSRFWLFTGRHFGWSVELSYQVLSCLAGGVFVFLLLTYCRALFPDRRLPAFVLIISGGYMQLFFGDVENYTLTAAWVMGYFLAAAMFVREKVSVVVPSLLLAAAVTFHLLAGFLLPSLVYLWMRARRRGQGREALLGGGVFCLTIALTLLFFDRQGLPLSALWYKSHALGQGGHFLRQFAVPSLGHYVAMANLAFLLAPAWMLVVPLLMYRRIQMDALNTHLAIASGCMTAYVLVWKPQLGVYMDWNLFAIAALPVSLLVWRNVLRLEIFRENLRPVAVLGLLFFAHSYSWIVANHFR